MSSPNEKKPLDPNSPIRDFYRREPNAKELAEMANDMRINEIHHAAEILSDAANLAELTGPQFEQLLHAVRSFDRDMLNENQSDEERAAADALPF